MISLLSTICFAMDNKKTISFNPQKILQTPLVSRLEKGAGYQPFNLNMQTYYETNQKFNNKLRRISAIRNGKDVSLAELEKTAASGNLTATLKIANTYLSQKNQKKQQKAYTFLENTTDRFMKLHDKKWAIKKYRKIIANIDHEDMYKMLQKKSNGTACYILGRIVHLQYLFSPTKKDSATQAIDYYELALSQNVTNDIKGKIHSVCGQLYNIMPNKKKSKATKNLRDTALLYINKKDATKKERKHGYQMLQKLIEKNDKSIRSSDLFILGSWYRENNEFEAFPILRRLANINIDDIKSEKEKEMIQKATLFVGNTLLCGLKKNTAHKTKNKNNGLLESDLQQAEKYMNKSLQLGSKKAHFYLGTIAFEKENKKKACQEYEKYIKTINIREYKQKKQFKTLTHYSVAQWRMIALELSNKNNKKLKPNKADIAKVTNRIDTIIHAHKYTDPLDFLYKKIDPVLFNQLIKYTNAIKKADNVKLGALNLCYLFGRICVEVNKNQQHGLHILSYAADNGHALAQAFLGLLPIDDDDIEKEDYLIHALCNKRNNNVDIKKQIRKEIHKYAQGGSLIALLAQASQYTSDKDLEHYLTSYKSNNNEIVPPQDYRLKSNNYPKKINEVVEKIKKMAQNKKNVGALILAGRSLIVKQAEQDTIASIEEGVNFLSKAHKRLPQNKLISHCLLHGLNKMGAYHTRKKNFVISAQFFARAIQECDNIEAKINAAILFFQEKNITIPFQHFVTQEKRLEEIMVAWLKEGTQTGNTLAMTELGHYYVDQKNYTQALNWYKKAKNNDFTSVDSETIKKLNQRAQFSYVIEHVKCQLKTLYTLCLMVLITHYSINLSQTY